MKSIAAVLREVRRALRAAPLAVGALRAGTVVTAHGLIVPRDLIDCPLTGEICVYYRYTVERWRRSRVAGVGGDGFWETQDRDEAIAEFYLADPARPEVRAVVAPHGATVHLGRGVVPRIHQLDADRRGVEVLLRSGDRIEISASVEEVHDLLDEARSYRAPAQRLMLTAPTIVLRGPR